MGWFRRSARAEDPAHPAPVEIDLGMRVAFEVEMAVAKLQSEGCQLYLVDQSEIAKAADVFPKHCRVLVAREDEAHVRAELTAAGFL